MPKILVGTDFSTRSDRAIRRALILAQGLDAELRLVHVVDSDRPERLVDAEAREAEALLRALAETLARTDGVACRFELRFGEAFEGVLAAAAELDADLLVLGPPRRQLLRGVITGTTVERVVRAGERPVLVANGVPAGPYRRILFATDLSPGSARAAAVARALGLDRSASILAVHVFPFAAASLLVRTPLAAGAIEPLRAQERRAAAESLARFLAEVGLVRAHRSVLPGERPVPDLVLEAAQRIRADLFLLATRGRTGFGKLLLGSVAEELLRRAELDLLAVPPDAPVGSA
ncbi:MAG: universal stress protein [Geminicoccaceae bacterium]|nr:universal stress protein [Geminicoccaceae bacterium]MCX7631002.1 universal stress protein [Geminicoccaceae bacterium]MDW8341511.1 universal stress protein [Geminicoccaceae bacterium]